jgi:hypothetical protein
MISNFCKTYLALQGVEFLPKPREKTMPITERKPVATPVKVPQYEREG